MSNHFWIKLYHEMLDDPKVGHLTDRAYRTMINCFLLAGDTHEAGLLPSIVDMAWRLHCDETALLTDLETLAEVGILTLREDGRWVVTKFARRQQRITDAEKQKAYRERQRNAFYAVDPDAVTVGNAEEEPDQNQNTEGEVEIEADEEALSEDNAFGESNDSPVSFGDIDKSPKAELKSSASAASASLSNKLCALTGLDLKHHQPNPAMQRLLDSMHQKGVLPVDIQSAWDWYTGRHGYPPARFDVLKKPILTAMAQRLQKNGPPPRSTEFDAFVQS